jgi:ElaB/YqjD/DUF883 family membrane-anchored ribosome-binding protein
MARRTKASKAGNASKLAKSVIALAATALLKKAIQKAAEDPKVRRKVEALVKEAEKRVRAAGRKAGRAAKSVAKRAPDVRRAAVSKARKLAQR